MAYKRANVLGGNQGIMAANYWYDIGLTYYYRHENATRKKRSTNSGEASQWLGAALHCLKASLQFEEENATVWNALGVASFTSNPKISQHAFIKSIEYDSKVSHLVHICIIMFNLKPLCFNIVTLNGVT